MTLKEMRQKAEAHIRRVVQAECEPVITADVPAILAEHQRAKIWAPSTAYGFGDVVQLPTRNGHRYVCITPGVSGAEAPTWSTRRNAGVFDGTAVWKEDGPDYENVFDVVAAVHACWVQRVAMTAGETDWAADDARDNRSQLHKHCVEMEEKTRPVGIS
jgi:hypothetical protein